MSASYKTYCVYDVRQPQVSRLHYGHLAGHRCSINAPPTSSNRTICCTAACTDMPRMDRGQGLNTYGVTRYNPKYLYYSQSRELLITVGLLETHYNYIHVDESQIAVEA